MYNSLLLLLAAIFLTTNLASAGDYVIGGGDLLDVSVWMEPELSAEVIVRPDGKITLPAIGDVVAAGTTPPQLAKGIKKALRSVVKEPVVTLTVAMVTNSNIYVAGGGVPSEIVPLTSRISLFKFLCRFSSFESADLERAYLMRDGKKINKDLQRLFVNGDFSQDIALLPNDIVFIPHHKDNKVYVVGAVMEPKYIYFRNGIKVLDAILEAGGFTEYADQSEVVVIRNSEGSLQEEPNLEIEVNIEKLLEGKGVQQNLLLRPGDYVTVNEGIF